MIRAECRVMCSLELITTTVGFIFDLKRRSFAPHKRKDPKLKPLFHGAERIYIFFLLQHIRAWKEKAELNANGHQHKWARKNRNVRGNSFFSALWCPKINSLLRRFSSVPEFNIRAHRKFCWIASWCRKRIVWLIYFGPSQRSSLELDVRNSVQK